MFETDVARKETGAQSDAAAAVDARWRRRASSVVAAALAAVVAAVTPAGGAEPVPLSPTAIVAAPAGRQLYVAGGTANAVAVVDERGAVQRRIELPGPPSGLALAPDAKRLAVTCAAPQSVVCIIDTERGRVIARIAAGHTAMAPVFGPDGNTLYVCNRFNHDVAVLDVKARRVSGRIGVEREPVAAALTRDGAHLLVVNHLPAVPASAPKVAAAISVIETAVRKVVRTLEMPNGSNLALGIAVSPDGRLAAVTHNLARFYVPTTQLDRGWMNTAAISLFELASFRPVNTVLLDNVELGAANPWAVAWTPDGRRLLVTHAGTHELSVIDAPALLAKLERLPETLAPGQVPDFTTASNVKADVPTDLAFLVGLRQRVRLKGNGPRALAVAGEAAWVAGYFSDTLEVIDVGARDPKPTLHALGPAGKPSEVRRGEMLFNDATICFQQWQSCASCHSYDARVDALNWDLLNDGLGSPKNTKSLVWSHRTPPAMSMGVRATAEVAVRAGIRHSMFAVPTPDVPAALDEYLKSLQPAPSPYLEEGELSRAARRGKKLFEDPRVGCAACHPAPLFTDLKSYDVGTRGPLDGPGAKFDTPTLIEMWRTAPYLHDGSARTMRDVLSGPDHWDLHGKTSHLTEQQIDDLAAYVLSL
jgi:YVTN family beta-propeller protein